MTRPRPWSLAIVLTLLAGCASGTRSTQGVLAQGSPEPVPVTGSLTATPPGLAEGERVLRRVVLPAGQRPDGVGAPVTAPPAAAPATAPAPELREGERVLRRVVVPAGQRPDGVETSKPQARVVKRVVCPPTRRVVCPPNLNTIFCPTPAAGCEDLCPGGRCGVPR